MQDGGLRYYSLVKDSKEGDKLLPHETHEDARNGTPQKYSLYQIMTEDREGKQKVNDEKAYKREVGPQEETPIWEPSPTKNCSNLFWNSVWDQVRCGNNRQTRFLE